MIEYRISKPEERDAIIDFGNYIYSYDGIPLDSKIVSRKLFSDLIPEEDFAKATYVAVENEKIMAMACCPVINATICDLPITVGQVGMIATHIYGRGKGYMKGVMQLMLDDMKNVDILMLGGKHQRYQIHGFEHAGAQVIVNFSSYSLNRSFGKTDTSIFSFEEFATSSDLENKCYEIYKEKMPAIYRTKETFDNIIRSFDRKPVAILKNGEFFGYFITDCYTVGYPTTPGTEEIPELFIKDESLLGAVLLAWQQKTKSDNLKLCVFPTETERLKLALPTCENTYIESVEMIKVNNWLPVLRACLKLKELTGNLPDAIHVLQLDGNNYLITIQNGKTEVQPTDKKAELVLSGLNAIETIFSPVTSSVPALNPLPDLFPLPLVIPFTDKF